MKLRYLIPTLLLALSGSTAPVAGAVQLSSLNSPTLQTLIAMGNVPVAVGPYQFSNFSFIDSSTGTAQTAAQVKVLPYANDVYGLQFVTNWFAADGNLIDDVIGYDITVIDPTTSIAQINLLSNSTAPSPKSGTFTTTTLISQAAGGATASPIISTYNDGFTVPTDTTKADVNYIYTTLVSQKQLHIIDTYIAISTPGGVTTASVLQNTFVSVPEPTQIGLILLAGIGFCACLTRPQRQGASLN